MLYHKNSLCTDKSIVYSSKLCLCFMFEKKKKMFLNPYINALGSDVHVFNGLVNEIFMQDGKKLEKK